MPEYSYDAEGRVVLVAEDPPAEPWQAPTGGAARTTEPTACDPFAFAKGN